MSQNLEIKHRKPIWLALSEFYLDTELQSADYDAISKVLKASGLGVGQLKEIDKFEVFSVLKYNLLSVAGVWTGFDEAWLYETCTKSYLRKHKPLFRLKNKIYHLFLRKMTKDHWFEIEKRIKSSPNESGLD
ncbi:MAG: hypothetical protein AAFY00_05855 [Bacteroidota bacterium]